MSNTPKVRAYLDIDGVFNAWEAHRVWGEKNITEQRAFPRGSVKGYRIVWSKSLVDEINSLDIDFVTASTWQDEASEHIWNMLGIEAGKDARWLEPPLQNGWRTGYYRSIQWKRLALLADQAENPSPFIWIDDELENWPNGYGHDTLGLPEDVRGRGLIIGPNPNLGITPGHITQIKEFSAKHS